MIRNNTTIRPALIVIVSMMSCLAIPVNGNDQSLPDTELQTLQLGENTWFVLDNNLPDYLELAKKENKLIFFIYQGKHSYRPEEIKAKMGSQGLSDLLDRVIPLYSDSSFDQRVRFNFLIGRPDYWPFLFILLDSEGNVCDALYYNKLGSNEAIISWFDQAELRHELEQHLEDFSRNRMLKSTYFELVHDMCFYCFFLKIEKMDMLIALDLDPKSWITQRAYEQKIIYFDKIAQFDLKKPYDDFLRSIEPEFLHVFDLYLPNKFQFALGGYRGFEHLMDFYFSTDRPEKALEVFDRARRTKLPSYCRKRYSDKLDLYDQAALIIRDVEKDYERVQMYFDEVLAMGKNKMKPRDRRHYYRTYHTYTTMLMDYWKKSDPCQAKDLINAWYSKTQAALETAPDDLEFRGFSMRKLLNLALDDGILIEEALDESSNLREVYGHYHPYFPLVTARAKLLARERSMAEAGDFLIATLSDERLIIDAGYSALDLYEKAIRSLLDWQLTKKTSLDFVEKVAGLLPGNKTSLLLAEFYAARKDYEKAINIIDSLMVKLDTNEMEDVLLEIHRKEYSEIKDRYREQAQSQQ